MTYENYVLKHNIAISATATPFQCDALGWPSDEEKNENLKPLHFACALLLKDDLHFWRGDYSVGAAHPMIWAKEIIKDSKKSGLFSRLLGCEGRRRLEKISTCIPHKECVTDFEIREKVREAYRKRAPLAASDVLGSLALEWRTIQSDYCLGFVDWAETYGYDTDSRSAYAVFSHIQESAEKARSVLGVKKWQELLEIDEDQ